MKTSITSMLSSILLLYHAATFGGELTLTNSGVGRLNDLFPGTQIVEDGLFVRLTLPQSTIRVPGGASIKCHMPIREVGDYDASYSRCELRVAAKNGNELCPRGDHCTINKDRDVSVTDVWFLSSSDDALTRVYQITDEHGLKIYDDKTALVYKRIPAAQSSFTIARVLYPSALSISYPSETELEINVDTAEGYIATTMTAVASDNVELYCDRSWSRRCSTARISQQRIPVRVAGVPAYGVTEGNIRLTFEVE
ncbi:hypothetical protein MXE97_19970 [Escherichia coli]|nr:hypothetical protein [Escherichia coli]